MLTDLIAQTTVSTPDGWGNLIATYGPFAPFAALTLWLLRVLWDENKEKDRRIETLTETAIDKLVPLVLEATKVLGEAVEVLHRVGEDSHRDMSAIQDSLSAVHQEVLSLQDSLSDRRSGKG